MENIAIVTPNYEPNPKQVLLHNAPVSYTELWLILYGGQRGGGKSAGALADAFMFAQTYPGAKICILRESLDSVRQSFLDKLPSLFPQEIRQGKEVIRLYEYRDKASSWYPSRSIIFPNGSYITFQRVASYQEALEKQGWEFHMLVIDEVTKQEERTFDYLLTVVRSTDTYNNYTGKRLKIPTKVVLGCNPGGIGHKWVKRRFIDRTVVKYNEFNTPVQTRDAREVMINPFTQEKININIRFIPASLSDNRFVGPAYVASLMKQPEHKKQMDLFGNWDVVAGRYFEAPPEMFASTRGLMEELKRMDDDDIDIVLSIDWGYKPSYHSVHWHAIFKKHNRVITFQRLYGQEMIFEEFVKTIVEMSEGFYITASCLPHDMFRQGDLYRDNKGKVIGETKADYFAFYGLNPESVASGKGKKQLRMDKIHSACKLKTHEGHHKFQISEDCVELKDELDNAVHSELNPEEIDKKCLTHAIDDYGLFLTWYADMYESLGDELPVEPDNRSELQRRLEEDERRLEEEEEDDGFIGLDNDFYMW